MRRGVLAISMASSAMFVHADGLVVGVSYAKRADVKGVEMELGYRKVVSDFGVNILPLTGIMYSNSNSKYREETYSNGSTVCRDTSNGLFADKVTCNNSSFSYGFIASGDYALTDWLTCGAGVRIGKKPDPFLTLRGRVTRNMSFQFKAGGKYTAAGFTFGF